MSKTLVIVESPNKIAKISQYLGSNYIVKASCGHVQDLDKKTLSIDVENNFAPLYKVSPNKTKVVSELKGIVKDCKDIILASDGDREGEAIAHSLATVLKIKDPKRIVFYEITKPALTKAIENPTTINYDMVYAQQARRLLDRLVGYKISPILWEHISNGSAKSAGRVQSVAVRIIADKEKEINKSISEPYFKTTSEFEFGEEKLTATLQCGSKLYQFESEELVNSFLSQINKKTEFKVISVDNKKSIRKPSQPFITSSLLQEASSRLHFSVKKTTDLAQKLFEAGLITYIRSDSPNISQDAINAAKDYIIKTFGKEYSEPKNYQSKSANSQDAHECIRPTDLSKKEIEKLDNVSIGSDKDQARLYELIWKRTIASQMSNAQVNVQTIQTDAINSKKSILEFEKQAYFVSIFENVEFPGYLIVYDNTLDDEEKTIGKLQLKVKDKLTMKKIKVTEEYTKPPLRYNEASFVKYLEKNGIGRPSTYNSIVPKILERSYVEIKDVEGAEKESKQIEMDGKFIIKKSSKTVFIGKEQKKLVPTPMGLIVNDFMMTNFEPIMDIEFTSNFETYLDKIAEGKANWVTVLRNFYEMFHPIVEKLNSQVKKDKQKGISNTDKLLGNHNGNEVFTGIGKYGAYVKIQEEGKWRYAPVKENADKITLKEAVELLEYPKFIGKIGTAHVTLNKGQYGFYFKCCDKNYSIKDVDPCEINIEYARKIIEAGKTDSSALKTFKIKDKIVNVKKGEYGPYIQIVSNSKKQNISIPSKYNIDTLTIDDVLQIIANKNGFQKK